MHSHPLADLIATRRLNRATQNLPMPKYMLAVTIDANTLDELQSAVEQFAVVMAVDWLNREEIDSTDGRTGVRLEVTNADQTPELYAAALQAWSRNRTSDISGSDRG